MKKVHFAVFISLLSVCLSAKASVLPEYAANSYENHERTRAEQQCINEGYKITYANCSGQTAPTDRCPHHFAYYKSCSQEQWCRNNNYTFAEAECQLPLYPHKLCDNKFKLYRICIENIGKACEDKGFSHQSKCQLNDKKCPYSQEYGKCCDSCPQFSHLIDAIPEGYVADGETCTTCDGIVRTNVKPAPCEGFKDCQYGPMSPQTATCLQGKKVLYSICKTPAIVCQEKGFNVTSCSNVEDAFSCPEHPSLKLCRINCLKQGRALNKDADIFGDNEDNPILDQTKMRLGSLVGMQEPECQNLGRPTLTFNISRKSMERFGAFMDRDISDVNLNLIFEEPVQLTMNGKLKNTKITAQGDMASCPLKGLKVKIDGTVSFNNFAELCADFELSPNSKLLTTGDITGNITMQKGAALGIKGNLDGFIRSQSFAEIFIKGHLNYTDDFNNNSEHESIVFGCNSKVKIEGGITAKTSNVFIKQWTKLDVPFIKIISLSDNVNLPNTLSSIHIFKYTDLQSSYGDVRYPLISNNTEVCDDKFYQHIGSATDKSLQEFSLEPSNISEDKWQCRELSFRQQDCD